MQDAFENFMDAKAREVNGSWFDAKVAGITHRNADGTERQDIARTLETFDELTLRPEPENRWDPKAVMLFTPAGQQLGYLEARLAAEVCRLLCRGGHAMAFVRTLRQRGEICGVSLGLVSAPGKDQVA